MYARSTTIRGNPGSLDDAIAYMRDEVWPVMQDMDGCVGLSMMCDRETGRCIATSAWADQQAMQASAEAVAPMRRHMMDRFGAGDDLEVQEWEIAVLHREHPAGDGACARITWTRADPGRVDQVLDMYRASLMPRIQEMPGFCSLSLLVDRQTGTDSLTAVYADRQAMDASRERVQGMREEFSRQLDMEVTDVAEFDLVLHHLRVPELV